MKHADPGNTRQPSKSQERVGPSRRVTFRERLEGAVLLQGEVLRNMAEGLYLVSAKDLKIIYANPKMEAMFGYEAGEMNGKHVSIINAPTGTDPMRTAEQIEKSLEANGTWRGEVLNIRKNGVSFWGQAAISKLHHPEYGEVYVSLQMDITERKQAEQSLIEREEFIRSVLDNVDEGFLVIDRNLRIITANNGYCDLAERQRDEIIGKHCYEVSHNSLRPCYEEGEDCAVMKVFETGAPHAAMHRHEDAKGNVLYVETKAFPLRDLTGAVTAAVETIHNITDRQLLEEEQLKSQKLEAIGTLAGGIAHDFNNLLQGVFGYISMAKLDLDRKGRSFTNLEQAEKALNTLINLTNQLLTFSKGGKPEKKLLNLLPVVENSARFALSGSSSYYRLSHDDELWLAEADEGQIAQVIQNIVLNSDESMPDGGVITISARNVEIGRGDKPALQAGGKFISIVIEDSGLGIPKQYLPRIFDPYFTTKQKGSGLGLATSYSIIKNHGGTIEVRSEQNRGSTFSIYLPASETGKEEVTHAPAPAVGRKGQVLVMDDEEIVRLVASMMLKSLGHEVTCAENGTEAIEKFRKAMNSGEPFDVVILDLTVKGSMGGMQAAAELREIDPNVKIIVSSGYADNAAVSNYRSYGFAASLNKPYTIELLSDTLNNLLRQS